MPSCGKTIPSRQPTEAYHECHLFGKADCSLVWVFDTNAHPLEGAQGLVNQRFIPNTKSRQPTEADHEALAELTNFSEKLKKFEERFLWHISVWILKFSQIDIFVFGQVHCQSKYLAISPKLNIICMGMQNARVWSYLINFQQDHDLLFSKKFKNSISTSWTISATWPGYVKSSWWN